MGRGRCLGKVVGGEWWGGGVGGRSEAEGRAEAIRLKLCTLQLFKNTESAKL